MHKSFGHRENIALEDQKLQIKLQTHFQGGTFIMSFSRGGGLHVEREYHSVCVMIAHLKLKVLQLFWSC